MSPLQIMSPTDLVLVQTRARCSCSTTNRLSVVMTSFRAEAGSAASLGILGMHVHVLVPLERLTLMASLVVRRAALVFGDLAQTVTFQGSVILELV